MIKLHVVRHAGSGQILSQVSVHEKVRWFNPKSGTSWWIGDKEYTVCGNALSADEYNTGDPKGSITVYVL